jgi:hypothetical protein
MCSSVKPLSNISTSIQHTKQNTFLIVAALYGLAKSEIKQQYHKSGQMLSGFQFRVIEPVLLFNFILLFKH